MTSKDKKLDVWITPNGDWWSRSSGDARMATVSVAELEGASDAQMMDLWKKAPDRMDREVEREYLVDEILCKRCVSLYIQMLQECEK